ERGYDDIVAIIDAEEQRRRGQQSGVVSAPAPDDLFRALVSGDDDRAMAMMDKDPALVRTSQPLSSVTPLHVAARTLNARMVTWLVERGADVNALARVGHPRAPEYTPLDLAAHWSSDETAQKFAAVASTLLQ